MARNTVSHLRKPAPCTQAELRSVLHYNPGTGLFTWIAERGRRRSVGWKAGGIHQGRYTIKVFGKLCQASNLVWLYVFGRWPNWDIDHKDRNPSNNRLDNLREVTRSQNCFNQGARITNTSGFKGVTWSEQHQRWRVRIQVRGTRIHIGMFDNLGAAGSAYRAAAKLHHGEFSGV